MKRAFASSGVTLVEALIGLIIFMAIALPFIRHAVGYANSANVKDLKIACALLRGECAVMYKNQKMPQPQRLITIDNCVYEISSTVENDSAIVNRSANAIPTGDSGRISDSSSSTGKMDSLKLSSGLFRWSMTVRKAGKPITGVHGLLYVPPASPQVQN
jgi:hypothetical protein